MARHARGNPKSDWESYLKAALWVKVAVYAGMFFVAYKAFRANQGTLANNPEGTTVTIDTANIVESGVEALGVAPRFAGAIKTSTKRILDRELSKRGIRTW